MFILWTDIALWLVILGGCFSLLSIRKNPIIWPKWQLLLQQPLQILVIIILLNYLIIALLDSLHWSAVDSLQVFSVLDWLYNPVVEQTFSAPFAITSYSPQIEFNTITQQSVLTYPRLLHVNYAVTAQYKHIDILVKIIQSLVFGGLMYALFRKKIQKSSTLKILFIELILLLVIINLADSYHILGTNKVGIDVLYSCLKSIRTGILLGILTIVFMVPIAVILGTVAGYFGKWLDDAIQFTYTVISSVPSVLLISAAMLSLQVWMDRYATNFATSIERIDLRLILLCLVLGLTSWTGLCRLLRAQCLHLREMDYVTAAKVLGVSHWSIITRHLIPNLSSIILIAAALDFSFLVLAEAVLSYVGVGVDPLAHSWGNMINSARLELAREPVVWWSLLGAFGFMLVLVLAANLFADSLREIFDPKGQV